MINLIDEDSFCSCRILNLADGHCSTFCGFALIGRRSSLSGVVADKGNGGDEGLRGKLQRKRGLGSPLLLMQL